MVDNILESGSFAGTWLGWVVYVHSNIIPHAILFLHRPVTVFYMEKLCGQKLKQGILFPITWFFCTDVLCACTWICVCVSMCVCVCACVCVCVCLHAWRWRCLHNAWVCMWKEGDTRAHIGVQGCVRREDVGRERGGQIQNQNFLRSKNVYLGIKQQYHKSIWHHLKSLTHTHNNITSTINNLSHWKIAWVTAPQFSRMKTKQKILKVLNNYTPPIFHTKKEHFTLV